MATQDPQAKYKQLTDYLKDEIVMGRLRPMDQIPSEHTLCETLGFSRHTVRKAIAILVNEGFLFSEHGRGTFVRDRSLNRGASRNIGVVTTYIADYIFPRVIAGIDKILSENGYSIMLKNTGNQAAKEALDLEDMLVKDIEGLIVEPTRSALYTQNIKYYEALERQGVPVVFIHGAYPGMEDRPRVCIDDAYGTELAVRHLCETGHRHIVGIFKNDDAQGILRHKGFARAISEAGQSYNPDAVVWFHTEDRDIKPWMGLKALLDSGAPVDAVICYNDEIAAGVMEAMHAEGIRVPEDISVIGFDDSSLASSLPVRLTSLTHPKEQLGEAAAALMMQLLRHDPVEEKIISMKPELVVRESVRPR